MPLRSKQDFFSIPIHCRPKRCATTAVMPVPTNGSRTMSPGSDDAVMIISKSRSGFCVGWNARPSSRRNRSFPCTIGNSTKSKKSLICRGVPDGVRFGFSNLIASQLNFQPPPFTNHTTYSVAWVKVRRVRLGIEINENNAFTVNALLYDFYAISEIEYVCSHRLTASHHWLIACRMGYTTDYIPLTRLSSPTCSTASAAACWQTACTFPGDR
jgi:hypothetical protein